MHPRARISCSVRVVVRAGARVCRTNLTQGAGRRTNARFSVITRSNGAVNSASLKRSPTAIFTQPKERTRHLAIASDTFAAKAGRSNNGLVWELG